MRSVLTFGGRKLGLTWLKSLFIICCLLLLPSQALANIGKVIGVKQGAEITRSGKSQPVRAGMEVVSGDSISTNGTGLVQLVFVDETKIAIGPNARMKLDVTMLRSNRKAKNFAVQALGGSFRFISGKSRKRAYSIQTPTATMAVRGTTFDMWVVSEMQSAMLVLEGTVRMCGARGSCRTTGRQCSMFATSQQGNIGRPVDQEHYELALKSGFPFIQSQAGLKPPLQVDFAGCAAESVPIPIEKAEAPPPTRATPQKVAFQAEPPSEPPSEPPNEPPSAEPAAKTNKSGHQDGSNPGGQSRNASGVGNPGKGKGRDGAKGRGKGKKGNAG